MPQTTPSQAGPRKETLLFLRTFARIYHPTLCGETNARILAAHAVVTRHDPC